MEKTAYKNRIKLLLLLLCVSSCLTGCATVITQMIEEQTVSKWPEARTQEEVTETEVTETMTESVQSTEPVNEDAGVTPQTQSSGNVQAQTEASLSGSGNLVPDYVRTSYDYETYHFEWESRDGAYDFYIDLPVDMNVYRYYSSLDRYLGTANYLNYIGDAYNEEMVEQIVYAFEQIRDDTGYSQADMVREIIHFVQVEFTYQSDDEVYGVQDYPKYPIETVVERSGDCEDTAFLAASIIRDMGYGAALLIMDSHCAVGVKGDESLSGTYYAVDGVRYYYVETTNVGYEIGMTPDNIDTSSARVYVLP